MGPEARREPPVYRQIADHIRDQIAAGELKPGDPIPSLSEIADIWGHSKETARRSHDVLRAAGLIASHPGVATVVADTRTVPAPAEVATLLGLPDGTEVRVQVAEDSVLYSRL